MRIVLYRQHRKSQTNFVIPAKLVPEDSNRGAGIHFENKWIPGQARNDKLHKAYDVLYKNEDQEALAPVLKSFIQFDLVLIVLASMMNLYLGVLGALGGGKKE